MPQTPTSSIALLQLTDTHLFPDADQRLLGVNTWHSFQAVLRQVAADPRRPDRILASGDLAQRGHPGAYEQFLKLVEPLAVPVHALPGNHDDPRLLQTTLGVAAEPIVDCGPWRLILLDTSLRGSEAGHLAQDQLDLLQQAAQVGHDRHVLVAMHHNPIPMGSAWLDTMQIDNAAALFDCLDSLSQVRAVVWGHVHQAHDSWHQRPGCLPIRLLSTPSTCFQFLPGSTDFSLDTALPGYRWILLHPEGRLDTEVVRIPFMPVDAGQPQMLSSGY